MTRLIFNTCFITLKPKIMLPDVLSFLLVSTRGFQKSLLVLFFIVAGTGGANAQSIHFLLDDKSENVYSLDEVQSIVLEKRQPLKIRFVERPELVYTIGEIAHAYFSFPTSSLVEQASDRSGYAVYPNPVEDVLSIYAPAHASGVLSLELFSTAGMLVYAESFGSARSQARVNVSDLKPGLYLCRIGTGASWEVIKFQKR